MEKIRVGLSMATRWTDPPIVIIVMVFAPLLALIGGTVAGWYYFFDCCEHYGALYTFGGIIALYWFVWNFIYMPTGPAPTHLYVEFHDDSLRQAYSNNRIPMVTLYDSFMAGKLDLKGDCLDILENHRDEFVSYKMTWDMLRFLVLQLFPNTENSSRKDKKATKKEIAEHYDRGNDFFAAFLGPPMVYTSAVYRGLDQTLEKAQDNKMSLICDKLQLKPDERFLDIGCGWGTLARHAATRYSADSKGVTLSKEGAAWCRMKNEEEGCEENCEILHCDYREIPESQKFDKISSIEMAEHVGIKNFQLYLNKVKDLMTDDGMFLMQVAGLRQGSNWQDIMWGLFMSRYIFPGADASTPLNWYIRQMEVAGYEVHSVETIGRHYSHTLRAWYHNFQEEKDEIRNAYDDRLVRLWDFFLAWSTIASGIGSATCYQILAHKNLYDFPRDQWCEKDERTAGVGVTSGRFVSEGNSNTESKPARGRAAAPAVRSRKKSGKSGKRSSTPSRKKD